MRLRRLPALSVATHQLRRCVSTHCHIAATPGIGGLTMLRDDMGLPLIAEITGQPVQCRSA